MRARGREINLHLQCFQLEKRHRFICEIANSRCLMWFMPTNKVVWTLILLHLFHNGERKQERSWIILGLQDPFHPGMWKSHFPLPGLVGLSGKAGYHPDHACSSSVMYAARPLRLERNQGGVKHFSQKGNDAKSLCSPPRSPLSLLTWSCAQALHWKKPSIPAWWEVWEIAELEYWTISTQ